MSKERLVVAVVGATGAVGREMLKTLEGRDFPAAEVIPFASARSAGSKVPFRDGELTVRELTEDCFTGIDIALFSAGGSTSEKFAPHAAKAGCVVIDNSSAWRMAFLSPACSGAGARLRCAAAGVRPARSSAGLRPAYTTARSRRGVQTPADCRLRRTAPACSR